MPNLVAWLISRKGVIDGYYLSSLRNLIILSCFYLLSTFILLLLALIKVLLLLALIIILLLLALIKVLHLLAV